MKYRNKNQLLRPRITKDALRKRVGRGHARRNEFPRRFTFAAHDGV